MDLFGRKHKERMQAAELASQERQAEIQADMAREANESRERQARNKEEQQNHDLYLRHLMLLLLSNHSPFLP